MNFFSSCFAKQTLILGQSGYTTEIAENGQVAIDKALKKRYDLILCALLALLLEVLC